MRTWIKAGVGFTVVTVLVLVIDLIVYFTSHPRLYRMLYPRRYDVRYATKSRRRHPLKAAITCLCRDVVGEHKSHSREFGAFKTRVCLLADCFEECQIVLAENDSTDGTRTRLCQWAESDDRVTVLPCHQEESCVLECKTGAGTPYGQGIQAQSRIERMAAYRNKTLEEIKRLKRSGELDVDVMLVYDFDIEGNTDMNGVESVLDKWGAWDAVFANGRMPFPPFCLTETCYDGLAFRERWDREQNLVARTLRMNRMIQQSTTDLVPVASAFNGLALYRYESIADAVYTVPPEPYRCEHVGLHAQMRDNGFTRLFISEAMRVCVGMQGPTNKFQVLLYR